MSRTIIGAIVVVLLVVAGIALSRSNNTALTTDASPTPTVSATPTATFSPSTTPSASATAITFADAKKAAHYVSNEPAHAATVTTVPQEVRIKFDFDLAAPSSISIMHDGKEYGTGETNISSDKLTLSRDLMQNAPNGLYTVTYKACWPDKSCHDGSFQFAIKR